MDITESSTITDSTTLDTSPTRTTEDASPVSIAPQPIYVVGIGASAGGIPALKELFGAMPSDTGMAFVVVLHLSPDHESQLAAIIQSITKMPVTQVTGTTGIEPNHVYVNPPTHHMRVHGGSLSLVEPELPRGRRVPIDLLFRTLGEAYREKAICIVLSGTGADGTLGLKRVKESGGFSIVQDPDEAEYSAMARNSIETNLVDIVLRIADIPAKLIALKQRAESFSSTGDDKAEPLRVGADAEALREILTLLKVRTGHDFTGYKRPTLLRRVARRLSVNDLESIEAYLGYLRSTPVEIEALLRDLLISVTNFFRDCEAFEVLEQKVIPLLFEGKGSKDVVRVWSAACATGEEAYSIAILLSEYASTLDDAPRCQVFASDIDADAIATAREGRYNDTITLDVVPDRLQKFFVKEGDEYRVKKHIRETVLFAQHNVLRDPPFSQLDFVSCRNLLIYLNRDAQLYVFKVIHFALRRGGHLMLGSSESADGVATLFAPIDRKFHVYKAKLSEAGVHVMPVLAQNGEARTSDARTSRPEHEGILSFGGLHHRLVEKYAPPSLLVNDDFEIVHISETGGKFLQFGGGALTSNLLKVIHPDLRAHLRAALIKAKDDKCDVSSQRRVVNRDGEDVSVRMTVKPCEPLGSDSHLFLVTFEENGTKQDVATVDDAGSAEAESHFQRLEAELAEAYERLRSRGEQSEDSDQELRSSNEELQSIIEELRSASEELETSKEELQSVNEELSTVNLELKNKVDEVSISNADLQNLLSSTEIATIFLDCELLIRRFTTVAKGLFSLIDSDIGRPLTDLSHKLDYKEMGSDAMQVLRTQQALEREVPATDGRTFIARLLPYRTIDGGFEGIVLTFIDITERKAAEATGQWLADIVSSSNDAIISFTLDGLIVSWNGSAERLFGYSAAQIVGKSFGMFWGPEHREDQRDIFAKIRRGEPITNYETTRVDANGESQYVSMSVSPISDGQSEMRGVTAIIQDITKRRLAETEVETAARRKDEFLAMLAHELRNPLAPILSGLEVIRDMEVESPMVMSVVGVIERQTLQMVRLVDDLLDISRINSGAIKLQKERVDVRSVITLAMETAGGNVEASHHTYSMSVPYSPVYIDVDTARITQVVVNLLNNAAKYTDADGQIWLSAESNDESIIISVRDTGIGLAPDKLTSIFDIFTQVENGQRHRRGGLGVGLSVVKNLVEMHGGSVEARSEGEGKGSEFIIRLPLAADQESELPISAPPHSSDKVSSDVRSAAMRILIVDDNVDAAQMLRDLLVHQKHDVLAVEDGTSAVREEARFKPDVCLIDIGLPDLDGFEVARRIRAHDKSVLLIAVTGWGKDEDRERSREAGFDHHLVKPVEFAVLKRLLADFAAGSDV